MEMKLRVARELSECLQHLEQALVPNSNPNSNHKQQASGTQAQLVACSVLTNNTNRLDSVLILLANPQLRVPVFSVRSLQVPGCLGTLQQLQQQEEDYLGLRPKVLQGLVQQGTLVLVRKILPLVEVCLVLLLQTPPHH